jgi:hypothetical protein
VWPTFNAHRTYTAYVLQLALYVFTSNLGVNGHSKVWEAHVCDEQFGKNESADIGTSRRLRKESYARFHQVSAMRPDLPKIIEIVYISSNFETPATDIHISTDHHCIANSVTVSLK